MIAALGSYNAAFAACAILTSVFCGGSGRAEAAEKVKIGWVPALVSSPLMIAVEKGYFKAEGIDLDLESVQTATDAMALLGTGRMQVLEGGVQANFFNAIGSKYPIVIAGDRASTPLGHLVMIRPDLSDAIKTLADLKGRTLGVAGAGSIIGYEMDKLLRSAGLSLKDTTVKIIPFPQIAVAFANKVIDAADVYAPLTNQLEQQKIAVRLMDPDDVLKNMVVAVTMINIDWARDKPDVAKAFFLALARGTRDYCQAYHGGSGRREVIDILVRTGIEKRLDILDLPWPSRSASGIVDPAVILDILDWYRENGFVRGEVARDKLVDNTFTAAANDKLGPFTIENAATALKGCR